MVADGKQRRGYRRRDMLPAEPVGARDGGLVERMLDGIRQNNDALRAAWARVIKRKEG